MSTTTTNTTNMPGVSDLRDRRRGRGLTQAQLALAAGLSINTVRNAEQGLPVSAPTASALERALGKAA